MERLILKRLLLGAIPLTFPILITRTFNCRRWRAMRVCDNGLLVSVVGLAVSDVVYVCLYVQGRVGVLLESVGGCGGGGGGTWSRKQKQ